MKKYLTCDLAKMVYTFMGLYAIMVVTLKLALILQ